MHLHIPTLVPRRQQAPAAPTAVLHVFHAGHEVRDEAEAAGDAAEDEGPCAAVVHTGQLKCSGTSRESLFHSW